MNSLAFESLIMMSILVDQSRRRVDKNYKLKLNMIKINITGQRLSISTTKTALVDLDVQRHLRCFTFIKKIRIQFPFDSFFLF